VTLYPRLAVFSRIIWDFIRQMLWKRKPLRERKEQNITYFWDLIALGFEKV
jgi:hypothetical protein